MKIIFWISAWLVIYTYLIYPAIVYLISRFYKQSLKGKYVYPTLSILMSVHNEEKNVEQKMQSFLNLDYPSERMEILIGSDGSTDRTNEIIKRYCGERVKLFAQDERKGKPTILNMLASEAKGELIVFTDARQRLDKDALKELVKHFSDQKVGSVSAELHFEEEDKKTGSGIGLYWEYEKLIRESESRMGSMMGATGALYAIRKELYPQLPKDLILDDVYIPMSIVKKGYRAIFDAKAKLYDRYANTFSEEFARKTRTLTGNFQLLVYMKWLINPFSRPLAWQFISHKFLRLMGPILLISIFVSNLYIVHSIFYQITISLQILFYTLAILGTQSKTPNKFFDVPRMFCVMNVAALVGLYRFLFRKQDVLWERVGGS